MAYFPASDDPFSGGEKIPSLSWRDLPHGSTFTLQILEPAKKLQERDFNTGLPKFWDAERTQPVYSAVVNVLVTAGPHSVGEERSIWATIPSDMYVVLKNAQKKAGSAFSRGGILKVRLIGEEKHKDPKKHPIKRHEATYTPGTPSDDAFGDPVSEPPTRTAQAATTSKAW